MCLNSDEDGGRPTEYHVCASKSRNRAHNHPQLCQFDIPAGRNGIGGVRIHCLLWIGRLDPCKGLMAALQDIYHDQEPQDGIAEETDQGTDP
jgi:hypothetical protein